MSLKKILLSGLAVVYLTAIFLIYSGRMFKGGYAGNPEFDFHGVSYWLFQVVTYFLIFLNVIALFLLKENIPKKAIYTALNMLPISLLIYLFNKYPYSNLALQAERNNYLTSLTIQYDVVIFLLLFTFVFTWYQSFKQKN